MIEKTDLTKWAVENVHEDGTRVRFMETPQEWTAELLVKSANDHFKANSLPMKSEYFKIRDKNGRWL